VAPVLKSVNNRVNELLKCLAAQKTTAVGAFAAAKSQAGKRFGALAESSGGLLHPRHAAVVSGIYPEVGEKLVAEIQQERASERR
jgi:hypothetical protein